MCKTKGAVQLTDDEWSFIFDSRYDMTAAEIGRALGRSRSTIQKFYQKMSITDYKGMGSRKKQRRKHKRRKRPNGSGRAASRPTFL